jgi:Protein of unknown function (DUF1015).
VDFSQMGLCVPRILLPCGEVDWQRWAVLACDQYSSQPAYWKKIAEDVGDAPSTLHQIIPECYLEDADVAQRIDRAIDCMQRYTADGLLHQWPEGTVLVERKIGETWRQGLMMAVDLEEYDYTPGAKPLIRPTEGTIVERIPPRLALRRKASVEYPHIMILIDDPDKTVIEPLAAEVGFETVYDFPLGWSGGDIRGRFVPWTALGGVHDAMLQLKEQSIERYGSAFLMAVGDGNHSLATAKAHWEEIKKNEGVSDHPARYALVELVNVHSDALVFEPIHRVLFDVPEDGAEEIARLQEKYAGSHSLPLGCMQNALDAYLAQTPGVRIDFIHGMENAVELSAAPGALLFPQEVIQKKELFASVANDGVLPRKSFSMGEADEKRFYLEGRTIIKA